MFSNIFSLHMFVIFPIFLQLFSSFIPLWAQKVPDMISIILDLLSLGLLPNMWSILENVACAFDKNTY